MRKLRILFIALNAPDFHALWNYLSIEALVGHIEGKFGEDTVSCETVYCKSYKEAGRIVNLINSNNYDVVGFSMPPFTLEIFKRITKRIDNIKSYLIMGNQLPTYVPEDILKITFKNKKLYKEKIYCVTGEGEETLEQIVSFMSEGYNIYDKRNEIYNLSYFDGENFCKSKRIKVPNFEKLIYPPKYDESRMDKSSSVQAQLSRGCSWGNCSYCTSRKFRKECSWKGFPISRIKKDLENLVIKLNVRTIEFSDDDFIGDRDGICIDRIKKIVEIIKRINNTIGERISFRIFTRPDIIFKPNEDKKNIEMENILQELKGCGLDRIYIGVESGSPSQLKRYRRGFDHEIILGALDVLTNLKIEFDCGFMLFDPELQLDEILENVDFYKKNKLINGNQWFWRPIVINKGSYWGDTSKSPYKLKKFHPESMSYDYEIIDPDVSFISEFIKNKSAESKFLFYALKSISKRHFEYSNEKSEWTIAKKLVEENGKIYVELIEDLANAIKKANTSLEKNREKVKELTDSDLFDKEDRKKLKAFFSKSKNNRGPSKT